MANAIFYIKSYRLPALRDLISCRKHTSFVTKTAILATKIQIIGEPTKILAKYLGDSLKHFIRKNT